MEAQPLFGRPPKRDGKRLQGITISARYENFPHARSVAHHIALPPFVLVFITL